MTFVVAPKEKLHHVRRQFRHDGSKDRTDMTLQVGLNESMFESLIQRHTSRGVDDKEVRHRHNAAGF